MLPAPAPSDLVGTTLNVLDRDCRGGGSAWCSAIRGGHRVTTIAPQPGRVGDELAQVVMVGRLEEVLHDHPLTGGRVDQHDVGREWPHRHLVPTSSSSIPRASER